MVEGLTTFSTWPRVRGWIRNRIAPDNDEIVDLDFHRRPALSSAPALPITSSAEILVTPAERPYPFPSRTRKSSSPAPKILRGQPFGKIGRRQGFLLSGTRFAGRARTPLLGQPTGMRNLRRASTLRRRQPPPDGRYGDVPAIL